MEMVDTEAKQTNGKDSTEALAKLDFLKSAVVHRSRSTGETGEARVHRVGISFKDLRVTVTTPQGQKTILHHVNGAIRPGTLTAIVGPSGAGKSTFLDVLLGANSQFTGDVQFNGIPISSKVATAIAYVRQEDVHLPALTVRETIEHSARFQAVQGDTEADIQKRVDDMLDSLLLRECEHTKVGNHMLAGISGGQMRRLSIAVSIIRRPPVLALDEPTSGLDANSALVVMNALRQLASQGHTVIATLHQPRYEILARVDEIMVLGQGRLLAKGPIDGLVTHLGAHGLACPDGVSFTDWLVDLASAPGVEDRELHERALRMMETIQLDFDDGDAHSATTTTTTQAQPKSLDAAAGNETADKQSIKQASSALAPAKSHSRADVHRLLGVSSKGRMLSMWGETMLHLKRGSISALRNPAEYTMIVVQAVIMGLLIAAVYAGSSQADTATRVALTTASYLTFLLTMCGAMFADTLGSILEHANVYAEQRSQNMVRAFPFFIGKSLVVLLPYFLNSVIYIAVSWFIVLDNADASSFWFTVAICFLLTIIQMSLTEAVTYSTRSFNMATNVTNVVLFFNFTVMGLVIPYDDLPSWLKWTYYLSHFQYMLSALMIDQFGINDPNVNAVFSPQFDNAYEPLLYSLIFLVASRILFFSVLARMRGGFAKFEMSLWQRLMSCVRSPIADGSQPDDGSSGDSFENVLTPEKAATKQKLVDHLTAVGQKRKGAGGKEDTIDVAVPMQTEDADEVTESTGRSARARPSGPVMIAVQALNYEVDIPNKKKIKADDTEAPTSDTADAVESAQSSGEAIKQPKTVPKQILHNINFAAPQGSLVALMGPSGSGKSTLLDIMAGRMKAGRVSGQATIGGAEASSAAQSPAVSYVPQADDFYELCTVREAIQLAADCMLPAAASAADRTRRVNEVMEQLLLLPAADTRIGGERVRGISGGERRRLTVALALVNAPEVILLDEPTTGLDAAAALQLVRVLRQLVNAGKTVICSIHQPHWQVLQEFDDLVLLSQGHMVYHGAVDACNDHFTSLGFERPALCNPADFIIDVVAVPEDQSEKSLTSFREAIEALASLRPQAEAGVDAEAETTTAAAASLTDRTNETPSGVRQFLALAKRFLTIWARDRTDMIAIFQITVFFFGPMLAILYSDVRTDDAQALAYTRATFFFMAFMGILFPPVYHVESFLRDRKILLLEQERGTYWKGSYSLAYTLSVAVPMGLSTLAFSLIVYWAVDLARGAGHFFLFVFVCMVLGLIVTNFTRILTMVFGTVEEAFGAVNLVFMFNMLFAGLFVGYSQFEPWLRWIYWLCFMQYGFSTLAMDQIYGDEDRPDLAAGGETVLGLPYNDWWEPFVGLMAWYIGFEMLNYVLIKFAVKPPRR